MISAGNSKLFVLMFLFYGYYCHFTGRHFECCIQILKFKGNFDSFRILYFPSSRTKYNIKTCRTVWGWVPIQVYNTYVFSYLFSSAIRSFRFNFPAVTLLFSTVPTTFGACILSEHSLCTQYMIANSWKILTTVPCNRLTACCHSHAVFPLLL